VASGLNKPTTFVDPNDGSGRFLVLERNGRIRWVADGQPLEQAFLDIRAKLHISGSEQGLLGLALDPNYAQNGRFYVDYTDLNGNTVIARYTAAEGHQTAEPAVRRFCCKSASRMLTITAANWLSAQMATCTSVWATAARGVIRRIMRRTRISSWEKYCA
jgi:hypothetical protein